MIFSGSGTSVTSSTEIYPSSQTGYYNNWQNNASKFIIAATLATSASTLPMYPIIQDSVISTAQQVIYTQNRRKKAWEAITDFAIELQARSVSLNEEDSKIWRQVILSQLKPGFPKF